MAGHAEVVSLLLEHGARPRIRSEDGDTAIALAARSGRSEIVELLEGDDGSGGGLFDRF